MDQLTDSVYTVSDGETVVVKIIPTKVGNTATFAIGGTPLTQLSKAPPTYQFQVSLQPMQTHFGVVRCDFASDTPADAFFQVRVSGVDANGAPVDYTGPRIGQQDPNRCDMEFRRLAT